MNEITSNLNGNGSPKHHKSPNERPLLSFDIAAPKDEVAVSPIKRRTLKFTVLGLEPTPELIAISMVYFVQGILGLSRLAVSFFFKDQLGADPAQVALITSLADVPWMVKPLYGFLSDSVPLFGYRRRSYLVIAGLVGALSWTFMATWVNSAAAATAMLLLGSLSIAFSDVVVDSIVVERARGAPEALSGSLQSLCWSSAAVGRISSAYFSGALVQGYGSRVVFGITAVFPLIVSASSIMISEQRFVSGRGSGYVALGGRELEEKDSDNEASGVTPGRSASVCTLVWIQILALWSAVRKKEILLPTLFVFLWQSTPSAGSAMFYFQTNDLHFTPEFMGRVQLAAAIASLLGVMAYNTFLKGVSLRRVMMGVMIAGVVLGSTELLLISRANRALGISDQMFVLGDSLVLNALAELSFMPILVLAARLCPEGVEATLFATLMSILNAGSATGTALGAALTAAFGVTATNFTHLFALYALCNFASLIPAPFLWLLPPEGEGEQSRRTGARSEEDPEKLG